jgi:hypothetical protein
MTHAGAVLTIAVPLGVPAFAFGRHLAPGRPLLMRVLVGLALGPLGAALALAPVVLARMPFAAALGLMTFVWGVIAAWPGARERPEPDHEVLGVPALPVALIAAALAALIAGVMVQVPFVRYWSDAWFHSGIAIEVLRHGLPPQDPNFAGIPLWYPWFFHGLLALLAAGSGLTPFALQMLLNVWAAAVLVLAAAHLAARLGGPAAAVWAGAIAVLGMNPLGWLVWLARAMTGDNRGLAQAFGWLHGIGPTLTNLSWGFSPTQASLLDRFWTGTALTPAIALALALAWSVADALVTPSRLAWVRVFLIAVLMTAFHPAFAVVALAAMGCGLVIAATVPPARSTAAALAVAFALTVALAYPYVRACAVPGALPPTHAGLYVPNVWAIALGIGPWWILAIVGLLYTRGPSAPARFARTALAVASLMALCVVLPERNSEKLVYLAWILVVPFAATGLALMNEWTPRVAPSVRVLALLLMLPTSALFTLGTARETRAPGVLVRGERPETMHSPLATAAEGAAWRMLRDQTHPDAVILEPPGATVNDAAPVLGERRAFCGALDVYLSNHFGGRPWGADTSVAGVAAAVATPVAPALASVRDEFLVRRGIQRTLYGGGALTPVQRGYLDTFEVPLYLWVPRDGVSAAVWDSLGNGAGWERAFHNADVRVYRWVAGTN